MKEMTRWNYLENKGMLLRLAILITPSDNLTVTKFKM
jgi:hypothetical protein